MLSILQIILSGLLGYYLAGKVTFKEFILIWLGFALAYGDFIIK